jgi:hypothetical protein
MRLLIALIIIAHAFCVDGQNQEAFTISRMVGSFLAAMYQLGFDFQAVPPAFALNW